MNVTDLLQTARAAGDLVTVLIREELELDPIVRKIERGAGDKRE